MSTKLKVLAVCSISALLLVGGIGLYVSIDLDAALNNSNRKVLPQSRQSSNLKSSRASAGAESVSAHQQFQQ